MRTGYNAASNLKLQSWSEERMFTLRTMCIAGETPERIADVLKTSKASVIRKAHHLGLSFCCLPVAPSISLDPKVLTRECCWPLNSGRPWRFCGAPTDGTYCQEHAERAKAPKPTPGPKPERSAQISSILGFPLNP